MITNIKNGEKYDVIVCGAGPAGSCAAIAAAKQGARTLLIEATNAAGGMGTMGLVSCMAPFSDQTKVIYYSLAVELMTRYKKRMNYDINRWGWTVISPEDLKIVYDEMLEESGAKILFQSTVCGVESENGHISKVLVANKEGITAYAADSFVDCTGDGDLAAFSGADFEIGEDGAVQSSSLCFVISNIKVDKLTRKIHSGDNDGIWPEILADGKYPLLSRHFVPSLIGDTLIVNGGHMFEVDSTNVSAVTDAYFLGRKIANQYISALKEYLPEAFGDSYLVETAPLLGVRESRRIKGEYTLTVEDYYDRRSFDDEISRNCYYLDCHPSGKNDEYIGYEVGAYGPGESHGIPYRCLIPVGFDNLLVAGRCISVDRQALASTRVMPNCLSTGEAAGIAAAIHSKKDIPIRKIDASEIRKIMNYDFK